MTVKDLLQQWEMPSAHGVCNNQYELQLAINDAARLHALAELYPQLTLQQIMNDLISDALEDVALNLPSTAQTGGQA
jgi:hypothetical protein